LNRSFGRIGSASLLLALLLEGGIAITSKGTAVAGQCGPVALSNGNLGATSVAPPEAFDPSRASDADLRCYGFPSRPTNPQLLAGWNETVGHAKHYVVPQTHTDPNTPVLEPVAAAGSSPALWHGTPYSLLSTNTNQKYAGYRLPTSQPQGTQNWYETQMEWVQPQFTFNHANQVWSIWDAIQDSAFPQAGTYQSQGSSLIFFWECSNQPNAVPVTNITVNPGDTVVVDTEEGAFSGGYNVHFFFEDVTTGGIYFNLYETCPSPTNGPAWFSMEVNDNLGTNGWGSFQTFSISYAEADSNQQVNYINYFNYVKDIIKYNATEIASPSGIGSYGNYSMCNC
jgi:hypothetical protein